MQLRPRSKSATLFFLSKNYYNLDQIVFPKKWKDFWSNCDVLVTDNPKLLKTKPKDKVSIKYQNEFNIDIKSDYTIINTEELFKLLKKLNKEITPNEIIKARKQFRTSVVVRSIYSEVLNIIQPIVIKKIKTNKNNLDKKYLNDALLTSIAGISAAMKNTG